MLGFILLAATSPFLNATQYVCAPPVCTNLIEGRVMGRAGDYNSMRAEDIAFLWEAMQERMKVYSRPYSNSAPYSIDSYSASPQTTLAQINWRMGDFNYNGFKFAEEVRWPTQYVSDVWVEGYNGTNRAVATLIELGGAVDNYPYWHIPTNRYFNGRDTLGKLKELFGCFYGDPILVDDGFSFGIIRSEVSKTHRGTRWYRFYPGSRKVPYVVIEPIDGEYDVSKIVVVTNTSEHNSNFLYSSITREKTNYWEWNYDITGWEPPPNDNVPILSGGYSGVIVSQYIAEVGNPLDGSFYVNGLRLSPAVADVILQGNPNAMTLVPFHVRASYSASLHTEEERHGYENLPNIGKIVNTPLVEENIDKYVFLPLPGGRTNRPFYYSDEVVYYKCEDDAKDILQRVLALAGVGDHFLHPDTAPHENFTPHPEYHDPDKQFIWHLEETVRVNAIVSVNNEDLFGGIFVPVHFPATLGQ